MINIFKFQEASLAQIGNLSRGSAVVMLRRNSSQPVSEGCPPFVVESSTVEAGEDSESNGSDSEGSPSLTIFPAISESDSSVEFECTCVDDSLDRCYQCLDCCGDRCNSLCVCCAKGGWKVTACCLCATAGIALSI